MGYLISIKTAIVIFPIIALIFTVPYILYIYHKYGAIHYFRTFIVYTFILYLLVIYFLVILPLPSFEEALLNKGPYINYIPFDFVRKFISETSFILRDTSTYLKAITEPCFYIVAFNILMTIPFGMYLRYYFKCSFKKTVLYSFLLSLFFELTQLTGLYFIYPNPYRLCDIDDLILNTLGGIIGYFIMGGVDNFLPTREEIDEKSLELGKKVSGLRRMTVFFLDIFIFIILYLVTSIYGFNKVWFYLLFIIYYIIIPIIKSDQTMGMKFLNVKIIYQKRRIINHVLRSIFVPLYYFFFPFWIFIITYNAISLFSLESIAGYIYLILCILLFFIYLIQVVFILVRKKAFYDKLFSFKFISTISSSNNNAVE